MRSVVSRVESLTGEDLFKQRKPRPVVAAEAAPAFNPVRYGKAAMRLPMKALASRARLTAIELCLDGSAFTATELQTPMRMSARRVSDHMKMLCQVGALQRRSGHDKREVQYVIQLGLGAYNFVRLELLGFSQVEGTEFADRQIHFEVPPRQKPKAWARLL